MQDKNPLAHYSGVLSEAVQESAGAPDQAQIKALMRKHRIWIEHSTLLEGDEPARELRAVQAEQHQFEAFVQDLIALSAAQAKPKSDYLEGVSIPNLREALIFLGRENGAGEGEVGDKLAQYVNSVVSGVLAKKATLREAAQAAPAAVAVPANLPTGDEIRAIARSVSTSSSDRPSSSEYVMAGYRAALAATPAAELQMQPVGTDAHTMELAERVGLLGPTSRTHDLHAAIQRFHDLIVVNASINASQDFAKELKKLTAAAPVVLPELGEIDNTAPERIYLVVNPIGNPEDRSGSFSNCSEVSWCATSQGGVEVAYVRADRALLAAATGLPAQAVPVTAPIPDEVYCALQYVERSLAAIANREEQVADSIERLDTMGKASKRAKAALTRLQSVAHYFELSAPQAQADARDALTPAARDVLAERARQITAEGWTPEHDDEHGDGSMAFAAAAYAVHHHAGPRISQVLLNWTGWCKDWWKPKGKRQDLIRAGALIQAEIERIDRAAIAAAKGE